MGASDPVPTPEEILRLDADGADALLDRLERTVPTYPSFTQLSTAGLREAVVFGDTHGDWRSLLEVERRYLDRGTPRLLVGLGDYVDRPPSDCGAGSVAEALHLLALAARDAPRVVLVQGNHETVRRIPTRPHTLPDEVARLWGADPDRAGRIEALLERGPLAATLPEGVYVAHAGFPLVGSSDAWAAAFADVTEETLAQVVWSECDRSRTRRAAAMVWTGRDLERLFRATGIRLFLRGHDPDVTGEPLYDGHCLTLHTTRVYERFGGVILARFPLGRPIESTRDLLVEHLATEGRTYPPVG